MDSEPPFALRGDVAAVAIDAGLVLLRILPPGPRFPPGVLTPTEEAVALAAFEGATTAEIATERGVSEKTVSNQLRSIYQKLGVASRAEMVAHVVDA